MARRQIQLPVHSYRLRSAPASTARLMNCYATPLPPDAKTRLILTRAPGVRVFTIAAPGVVRGMHQAFGDLFVLVGNSLWRYDVNGVPSSMGVIPGSGPVSMAHNRVALVIVTNPDAYWTDGISSNVTQITDVDYTSRGAKYVKFLDNFMLFMEPDSDRFFGADVGSVTSFDALNFASAEGNPDDLIGMEVDHRQAILLGTESGEIWENTGVAGFPFERAINGFFEIGCLNGDTIAKIDNSVAWVANDYTVRKIAGAVPQKISTPAVEEFLSTVDSTTLRSYSASMDGQFYYYILCSTGGYVYNAATNEWQEVSTYPNDYYEWQFYAQAHGRQYVGNAYSGYVGYLDPTYYKDGEGIQRMEWTYQPVYSLNQDAIHYRLEVVLETGVGLTTGQGSDPEIMMAYSDDGGITWTNLPNRKIGQMGQYRETVVWDDLGAAAQRVYRGAISDPVKVTIWDTLLDAEGVRI